MSNEIDLILIDKYSNFTALVDENENVIFENGLEISLERRDWTGVNETKTVKKFEKMIGQMIKLEK